MLALLNILRDVLPFCVSSFGYESILSAGLSFDLLDELTDKFVDSFLVGIISKNIENSTNTLVDALHFILFESLLFILLVLDLELLALFVQLLLQFDAEVGEFGRDVREALHL